MLEKYKANVNGCSRCGMCIVGEAGYVCPVQQHTGGFDQYVARGRNQIAKAILNGELEYTKELAENAYTCLGCNSCHAQCTRMDMMTGKPGFIDDTKIQSALRVDLCKAGYEPESLQAVDKAIDAYGNPFGEDTAKRVTWAQGLNLPSTGETVYFAGCYASYRNTKIAKATVAVLQAGGIDIAYLGEQEWCCGVPQLADGNRELAEKMIAHNVEALKSAGVKRVITSCAGCFHALKSEYPEIIGELPFEVVHSSELIEELIESGKISLDKEIAKKVTYHDPCHLARHEKVYDAPRYVIKAIPGIELIEMPRIKENALCCGGGSVVSTAFPELTKDIAAERVNEAQATEAEIIISACPSCESHLTQGARKAKMKVYDLNVLVAEAMGLQL
jgi:heterodisulfide reductase subunit D